MSPALIALPNSASSSSGVRAGMGHLLRWMPNETTVEDGRQLELAVLLRAPVRRGSSGGPPRMHRGRAAQEHSNISRAIKRADAIRLSDDTDPGAVPKF